MSYTSAAAPQVAAHAAQWAEAIGWEGGATAAQIRARIHRRALAGLIQAPEVADPRLLQLGKGFAVAFDAEMYCRQHADLWRR